MKFIKGKQLGYLPNGSVYSEIVDGYYGGYNYEDIIISGLRIMCGHDSNLPPESGDFCGSLHMADCITRVDRDIGLWTVACDDAMVDYTENDWFVVFDKEEVQIMIENLQWALNGCKYEEDNWM